MATAVTNFLLQYQDTVERRIREQIERHQRVNPNADPRRAVAMQMKQEREQLERLIEADDTTANQAEALFQLIAWLPQLERKLTGR
jgi:hypothetical protein